MLVKFLVRKGGSCGIKTGDVTTGPGFIYFGLEEAVTNVVYEKVLCFSHRMNF